MEIINIMKKLIRILMDFSDRDRGEETVKEGMVPAREGEAGRARLGVQTMRSALSGAPSVFL